MITQPTTLAEAGWKAYWDPLGHHPVKDGDAFPVTSSGTISIFYMCKPIQEEDGKWYANGIYAYEPFQHFIGGVYKKEVLYTDSLLCGTETGSESIAGKVEEFALWGKGLGLAGLINYQTNQTGMVGGDVGDRYATEQEALDDSLYHYFQYGVTTQLIQNFTQDNSASLTSRSMASGSGKFNNSSILDANDDYISIENMRFAYDFTMNIRFYMEDNKDFVLFRNKNAIEITYNEVAGTFDVTIYPYIGNIVTYRIEVVNMKVHHWYDFGVLYEDGKLSIVMDGNELESHQVNITIGGVERVSLHHKNVASVTVSNFRGGNTVSNLTNYTGTVFYAVSEDPVSASIMTNGRSVTIGHGGRNALDLMVDRDTNSVATFGESNLPNYAVSQAITDPTYDTRNVEFSTYGTIATSYQRYRYMRFYFNVSEKTDGSVQIHNTATFSGSTSAGVYNSTRYMTLARNKLSPSDIIEVKATFKNVLIDTQDVFPMMTMLPSTHMKVFKQEMIPTSAGIVDQIKAGSKGWGIYTVNNVQKGWPAFKNNTGKYLQVSIQKGALMVLVPNGYICYYAYTNLYVVSYDDYTRDITTDLGVVMPMSIIPIQD